MTRTGQRNLILICCGALVILAGLFYLQSQKSLEAAKVLGQERDGLQRELANVSRRAATLTELNQLTIDERTATQLNILRHLGLAKMDIDFRLSARDTRQMGVDNLYVRTANIQTQVPYAEALKLLDMLHANRKMVLTEITLLAGRPEKDDDVTLRVNGRIYGLEKRGQL
jgi:hypothetical protein